MANLNIAIQIAAQDKASGPIGKITNGIKGLAGTAGNAVSGGLSGLQTAVGVGLIGAAGLGVTAIGLIGTAAFGVSQDVQSANNVMVSEFGATAEEAEHLGNLAKDVWGNNFAGSITEAAGAIGLVRQQLGDLSDGEMQDAAENAFRLQDVFGVEVPEGISTVNTLMDEFGLSSEQAFDFLASGFQNGLDANGDFIDSIGEYSNLFADAGFSADEFFSLMETGAAGGVLGTDKISDAVKEMGIILSEGGAEVEGVFSQLGLDFGEISGLVASGDASWADYFDNIVGGLNDIEDPIARQQAQVAIFGTMAEDLGVSFTEGLSTATTSLDEMGGSVDSLDAKYNDLGSFAEGAWRKIQLAIQPVGDVMLNIANSALPLVDSAFAFLETNVVPAITTVAGFIQNLFDNLTAGQPFLDALAAALTTAFGGEVAAQVMGIVTNVQLFFEQVATAAEPFIAFVTQFVAWGDVLTALGIVVASIVLPALAGIVIAAAPVIAVGAALIAGIALVRTAWENDWGGIQGKVETAVAFIQGIITTVMTGIQEFWATNGAQILATATQVWQSIQDFIGTALDFIWNGIIVPVATSIQAFWAAHGETILATATEVWTAVSDFLSGIWDTITAVFNTFRAAFEGDWTAFGAGIWEIWETAWTTVIDFITELWGLMKPHFESAWTAIQSWWNDLDWAAIGRNVVDSLANSIRDGAGAIGEAASSLASSAWSALSEFFEFGSPSRLMIRAAGWIKQPLIEGLADTRQVSNSARALAVAANPAPLLRANTRPAAPPPVNTGTPRDGGRHLNFYGDFILPNVVDAESFIARLEAMAG